MPNHVHLVVHPSDGRIPELMKKVKSLSARRIVNFLKKPGDDTLLKALRKAAVDRKQDTYQVWQDGFHAVPSWSEWMIRKKIDYIHANPLRKRLVKSAKDYEWSSFLTYLGIGEAKIPLDPVGF
jgi:REP element-mobilizing transposase RayT